MKLSPLDWDRLSPVCEKKSNNLFFYLSVALPNQLINFNQKSEVKTIPICFINVRVFLVLYCSTNENSNYIVIVRISSSFRAFLPSTSAGDLWAPPLGRGERTWWRRLHQVGEFGGRVHKLFTRPFEIQHWVSSCFWGFLGLPFRRWYWIGAKEGL